MGWWEAQRRWLSPGLPLLAAIRGRKVKWLWDEEAVAGEEAGILSKGWGL